MTNGPADDGRRAPTNGKLAKALWESDTPAEALEKWEGDE